VLTSLRYVRLLCVCVCVRLCVGVCTNSMCWWGGDPCHISVPILKRGVQLVRRENATGRNVEPKRSQLKNPLGKTGKQVIFLASLLLRGASNGSELRGPVAVWPGSSATLVWLVRFLRSTPFLEGAGVERRRVRGTVGFWRR
jgi:hypothetical protein